MSDARFKCALLALTFAFAAESAEAAPVTLPVHGSLSNLGGPVPDGSYSMALRVYDTGSAGIPLYTETWLAVAVEDGIFTVVLGSQDPATPLDELVFASPTPRWIGITVEGDPELPRQPLAPAPFAVRAGVAHGIACSGCVDSGHIQALSITTGALVDKSVTGAKLADGSVSGVHIAPSAVGATHLATGSVGLAHLAAELQSVARTNVANTFTQQQILNQGADFAFAEANRFRFQVAGAAPIPCDAAHLAATYFDTAKGDLLVCNGTEWRGLITVPALGTPGNPGVSCRDILVAGYSLGSGVYWLRTSFSGAAFKVFCDMETEGGGWTRVANIRADVHICSYENGLGTETNVLTDTGSTGIMPALQAGSIPMVDRQVLVLMTPLRHYVFTSQNAAFTWPNIANGTIHSWNIQNYSVLGSNTGGPFAPLTGPATCGNGPCLLGGWKNGTSEWSPIIGIGSHDIGSFAQTPTCTSAVSPYRGTYTGHPDHTWGTKATIYIR